MFNFFEQPFTLLGISVIVLFIIFTFRSVFPEKRRWWQLLIPVFIAGAAFGIDSMVKTDPEKIEAVIDTGIKAIEQENINAMEKYVAEDYSDSFHNSKEELFAHINRELTKDVVSKNKKSNLHFDSISENKAKVILFMHATLNPDSYVAQNYPVSFIQMKVDVYFSKQNSHWLISRIEVRTINQQSVNWNELR